MMPSSNEVLSTGRLIGRLFVAFALGTILGFAVFYWFARHAFDFGVVVMDFIAIIQALFFLLVICFSFYCFQSEQSKISSLYYWLFGIGWLLAIGLTVAFYPGYDRYIAPPQIVKQQAQVLEKQLAQYPILWEADIGDSREKVRFELKSKTKGIGYMPYSLSPWELEWKVYYKDGTRAFVVFYLNGVEPVRLHSARFYYSNSGAWWQTPTADIYNSKHLDSKSLLDLPWAWLLADPSQPPFEFELSVKEGEEADAIATYPEDIKFHWNRAPYIKSMRDVFAVYQKNMKSPCREGWARLNICLPLKSPRTVPLGLLLY